MVKFPQETMEYFTKIFQKKIGIMEIYQGSYKSMLEHPQQERHGRWLAACCEQAQAQAPWLWQSAGPHLQQPPCAMALSLQEATSQPHGLKHSGPHVCSQFHTCVYLGNNHVYSLLTDYFTQCSQQGPLQIELQMLIRKITYIYACVCAYIHRPTTFKVKSLSRVQLFATPWHQAPSSMGFSRQEDWSGLPFPSPGNLPDPGIEPRSPSLQTFTDCQEDWSPHQQL